MDMNCSNCQKPLLHIDVPSGDSLSQCPRCELVFRSDDVDGLVDVTELIAKIAIGDDRMVAAMSPEHVVVSQSVMEIMANWRARSEMDLLAMIGGIQQKLGVIDNRLHSVKKRLAESILGEPRPIDVKEMMGLIDECIDMASPAPARERGLRG